MDKTNERETVQRRSSKDNDDENKTKEHIKMLYERSHQRFSSPLKKKRKRKYDPVEEARLERAVFGDPSDIINNLSDNESDTHVKVENKSVNEEAIHEDKDEIKIEEDDLSNIIDRTDEKKAAWIDEDDVTYSVNAARNAQNRHLLSDRPEKLYATYLENRYKQLVGHPKWAKLGEKNDDIDDLDILKHSCHLEVNKGKNLPKDVIDIKVLKALNKTTHTEGPIVTSTEFHPSSTVALVAGSAGILSLFQVDGHTNNKLHNMQFKKYPISKATFMKEGSEILLGSQHYAYCYTFDLMSDKTYKIPLPHGITNMKQYEVSPDGKLIALCGRHGEIYLLHSSTKELIGTLKMNLKCKALTFTPDSRMLITHGDGGEMYIWDLNSRTCINRAIDDGCVSCASLAASPNGQFIATGSKHGVVNIYKMDALLQNQEPIPLKIMKNLVTSITSLKFNPTSEILAAASNDMHNAFRMLHIPSFTIFSNFPTFQTNIGMPQTINFSPNSGYLSISNKTGSALLYRLKHYGNY
ncbi:hypothetical protein HN011_011024 [Eciton burchellii]|nr:hypothetical protein HN011_011024 [Eciton burchellii]